MAANILPIPGFPNYRVSDDGKVYSCRVYGSPTRRVGTDWWEMKPKSRKRCRHVYVDLFGDKVGKSERFFIHQLVMLAFVGPCPEGLIVCHKNDVGTDNRLENLYYGTKKDNSEDAIRNGLSKVGEDWWNASLKNDEVRWIRRLAERGATCKELSTMFGKNSNYIRRIVVREIWSRVI